jgi:hypothetical protein
MGWHSRNPPKDVRRHVTSVFRSSLSSRVRDDVEVEVEGEDEDWGTRK